MSWELLAALGLLAVLCGLGVFGLHERSRRRSAHLDHEPMPTCWRMLETEDEIRLAAEHALETERATEAAAEERAQRHEQSWERLATQPHAHAA